MWNELITIIEAQTALCGQLIALGEKQRECVLCGIHQQMHELMKAQESAFHRFTQMETKKQLILRENGYQEGVDLAKLLITASETEQNQVKSCLEKLQENIQNLRSINGENRKLLDNETRFIEFNINLMTQTTADDIYAPQGQSGSVISKKKMFDQTI